VLNIILIKSEKDCLTGIKSDLAFGLVFSVFKYIKWKLFCEIENNYKISDVDIKSSLLIK